MLLFADPFEMPKPSAGMVVRPNMTGLLGQFMQTITVLSTPLYPGGKRGYLYVHADKIT